MAKEEVETELDIDSEQSEDGQSSSGKSKKKLFLILGVLAAVAAGAGAYFFLLGSDEAETVAPEVVEVPIQEAFYFKLEPVFIINLPDKGKQRFLQTSITVMGRSHETILKVEQHMPVIRHHLTNVLSAQTISSIQSNGGIEQARRQALELLNRVLVEEYGGEPIEQVLFTSFVMQ